MRGGRNAKKIALIVFGVISLFMLCYVVYNFFIIKEGADNETPAQRYKGYIVNYIPKVKVLNDECIKLGGFKENPPTKQVKEMTDLYTDSTSDTQKDDEKTLLRKFTNIRTLESLLNDYKKTLLAGVAVGKEQGINQAKSEFEVAKTKADIEAKAKADSEAKKPYIDLMNNNIKPKISYLNNKMNEPRFKNSTNPFFVLIKSSCEIYSNNIKFIETNGEYNDKILQTLQKMGPNLDSLKDNLDLVEKNYTVNWDQLWNISQENLKLYK